MEGVPPPRKPYRAGSLRASSLRRLGVWIGVGGFVTLSLVNIAVASVTNLAALHDYWHVGMASVWALAMLAMLGSPVLIVIGWIKHAGERSTARRRLIEWLVLVLGPMAATTFIMILIAWVSSVGF